MGENEIARLEGIAVTGEIRGEDAQDGMAPLASVDESARIPRVNSVRR
jgi:hypothetical protein